jgi:hypothetical protein
MPGTNVVWSDEMPGTHHTSTTDVSRVRRRWFCRLCWRKGTLQCLPDDAIAEALRAHLLAVNYDSQALRVPAGVLNFDPDAITLPGAHCPGDITVGEFCGKQENVR